MIGRTNANSNLNKYNIEYEVTETALWSTTDIINNSNNITSLELDLSKYIGVRIDCIYNYYVNVTTSKRTQNFVYKDGNTHMLFSEVEDSNTSYRKAKVSDVGITYTITDVGMCCPVAIYGLIPK